MKKLIVCLLSFCLLLVMGCNQQAKKEQKFNSYICDVVNDSTQLKAEKNWGAFRIVSTDDARQEATASVHGKECSGVIFSSHIGADAWNVTDVYKCDGCIEFNLDRESQKLVGFNIKGAFDLIDELSLTDSNFSKDETEELIKKYASGYIDVDKYVMIECGSFEMRGYTVYHYNFSKFINGVETADRLWVEFTSRGVPVCMGLRAIGAFDGLDVSEEQVTASKQSVEEKIKSIYADKYNIKSYSIGNPVITYTPEGKLIATTEVKTSIVIKASPDGSGFVTGVVLATELE